MKPTLRCLFCKRKKKLFKIYMTYGRTERPIKDYIVDFFGAVETYLCEDHGVCSACVFILNKLIFMRNYMHETIVAESNTDCRPTYAKFAAAYKIFLHNLEKLNFDESDSETEGNAADLLKPMHSSPCGSYDSDGNATDRASTPYADKEVENTLKSTKRKRRKRSTTEDEGRKSSEVRYDTSGRLLNKRTRSVSQQQERNASRLANAYSCDDGCHESFADLNTLTEHKIEKHDKLAKYWCYECYMAKFTSQEDLDRHNQQYHHVMITNCPLCSEVMQSQEDLQKHLAEHRLKSVPCSYCDKYFLTGSAKEKHVKESHKGSKKRIKHRLHSQKTIVDRIDRRVSPETETSDEDEHLERDFSVKMLVQKGKTDSSPVVNWLIRTPDSNEKEESSVRSDDEGAAHTEGDLESQNSEDVVSESENNVMEKLDTGQHDEVDASLTDGTPMNVLETEDNGEFSQVEENFTKLPQGIKENCDIIIRPSVIDVQSNVNNSAANEEEVQEIEEEEANVYYPIIESEHFSRDIIESSPEPQNNEAMKMNENNLLLKNYNPKIKLKVVLEKLMINNAGINVSPSKEKSKIEAMERRRNSNRSRNSDVVVDFNESEMSDVNEITVKPKRLPTKRNSTSKNSLPVNARANNVHFGRRRTPKPIKYGRRTKVDTDDSS